MLMMAMANKQNTGRSISRGFAAYIFVTHCSIPIAKIKSVLLLLLQDDKWRAYCVCLILHVDTIRHDYFHIHTLTLRVLLLPAFLRSFILEIFYFFPFTTHSSFTINLNIVDDEATHLMVCSAGVLDARRFVVLSSIRKGTKTKKKEGVKKCSSFLEYISIWKVSLDD